MLGLDAEVGDKEQTKLKDRWLLNQLAGMYSQLDEQQGLRAAAKLQQNRRLREKARVRELLGKGGTIGRDVRDYEGSWSEAAMRSGRDIADWNLGLDPRVMDALLRARGDAWKGEVPAIADHERRWGVKRQ